MLVGSGLLRSPDSGSVTVTFTPRSWQLTLAVACPPEWDNAATTAAVLLINGHVDSAGGCSSTMTAPAATWQSFGLRLDRPATVTLTLVRGPLGRGILTAPPSVPPMQPSAQRPQGDVTVDVYDGGPADSSHGVIAGVVRQYGGPPLPNGHMADEGVPVSGETVGIESSRAITGKDGSFAIELRPGHYTLHGCQDVSVDVVAGVVTPVDVVCAIP
jgi:hypothetical protein